MPDYSLISCAEEHNSVSESYDSESGFNCSVTLRCPWSNRWALVQDVVGNRRAWPHLGFSNSPQAYSAAIRPDGAAYDPASSQVMAYVHHALVTINYSTKVKDLISESLEPSIEFQTLDYKRFRWGAANGDPLIEGEAPGRQVRNLALVRQHMELTALPTEYLTEVGKVNGSAYTSALLGLTFDTETLLFEPAPTNRTIKSDGSFAYTMTVKFHYKPETWNKFWRHKTKQYTKIYDVEGAEYKNYPLGNFSNLLA